MGMRSDERSSAAMQSMYAPAAQTEGTACAPSMGGGRVRAGAPDIDAGEQEQPHHIDEVPVPGGEFEAEMLRRREMAEIGTDQADDQERGADDDMEAMEPGRHEKGGAVDIAAKMEGRVAVLVSLHRSKGEPERDGANEAPLQALTIVLQQRVVRPGHRRTGGQQD